MLRFLVALPSPLHGQRRIATPPTGWGARWREVVGATLACLFTATNSGAEPIGPPPPLPPEVGFSAVVVDVARDSKVGTPETQERVRALIAEMHRQRSEYDAAAAKYAAARSEFLRAEGECAEAHRRFEAARCVEYPWAGESAECQELRAAREVACGRAGRLRAQAIESMGPMQRAREQATRTASRALAELTRVRETPLARRLLATRVAQWMASDGRFDPDDHGQTQCNRFVAAYAGYVHAATELQGLTADGIFSRLQRRSNPQWEPVYDPSLAPQNTDLAGALARAQQVANDGGLVVVAWRHPGRSHVAVVVPGELAEAPSWGVRVPVVAQAGAPNRRN